MDRMSAAAARLSHLTGAVLLVPLAACTGRAAPLQPSPAMALAPTAIRIEAEAGRGDGQIKLRSRASGGTTIHLGPGERRWWTFEILAPAAARYAVAITYANGKEGDNETLTVGIDGTPTRSFQNRDSGDSVEGWNTFITDPAGASTLRTGSHTIVLDVTGGDGCVEIDVLTLTPVADASM